MTRLATECAKVILNTLFLKVLPKDIRRNITYDNIPDEIILIQGNTKFK